MNKVVGTVSTRNYIPQAQGFPDPGTLDLSVFRSLHLPSPTTTYFSLGEVMILLDETGADRLLTIHRTLRRTGRMRKQTICLLLNAGGDRPQTDPDETILHLPADSIAGAVMILLPRDRLEKMTVFPEALLARTDLGTVELNNLVARYIKGFLARDYLRIRLQSESIESAIASQLVSMLVLSLEEGHKRSGALGSVSAMKLYSRAVGYIRENIFDPDLTPASVAAACGISCSYLHKLFSTADRSVARMILEMRLVRASEKLEDRNCAHVPISTIAFGSGFNNAAHFSTRFRKRFGMSPREYRLRNRKAQRRGRCLTGG